MQNLIRPMMVGAVVATGLLTMAGAMAQPERQEGPMEFLDPVYPAHMQVDMHSLPTPRAWRPGDAIKEIPQRKNVPAGYTPPNAAPRPVGEDPLRQIQNRTPQVSGGLSFDVPLINVEGSGFSSVNPPDTIGDVGLYHYVQMINGSGGLGGTRVRVLDKTDGSLVLAFNLRDLAIGSGTTCSSGTGDPIILFDQEVDNGFGQRKGRWLLTEFTSSSFCVYISETADFMDGGWYVYQFTSASGGLPDYPKWAVWPDAYYVGANEQRRLYAFDRENMLNGQPTRPTQVFQVPGLSGFGFQMLQPADWDGVTAPPIGAPGYFLRHRDDEAHNAGSADPTRDFLEIFEFSVDWDTPGNSAVIGPFSIDIEEFSSDLCGFFAFACAPQPSSGVTLDPLREPVMWRAQYRNFGSHEVIVGTFVTDVDGNNLHGVRWFELRRSGASPWELHQEGLVSPDNVHRWMSSIAMDGSGNIAVGYNVSDATTTFPGIRYIGRLQDDPPGTMPRGEVSMVEGSSANASNRYGDYASMTVDPVDDCTFWFTSQFNPASQWSTQIAAFRFPQCGEPGFVLAAEPAVAGVCVADGEADAIFGINVISIAGFEDPVTLAFNPPLPAGLSALFHANPVLPDDGTNITVGVATSMVAGDYLLTVEGSAAGASNAEAGLLLSVVTDDPGVFGLLEPADTADDVSLFPEFQWQAADQAETYLLEVATDDEFTDIVVSQVIAGTTYQLAQALDTSTQYYWRVSAENICGSASSSEVFSFTTSLQLCALVNAPIPDNSPGGLDSEIVVTSGGTLASLELSLDITHAWVGDLIIDLTHVDTGTVVNLVNRASGANQTFGCSSEDIVTMVSDDSPLSLQDDCVDGGNPVAYPEPAYSSNDPLADFAGEALAGTWRLSVSDNAPQDVGTLHGWCLHPEVEPPPDELFGDRFESQD